MRATKQARLGLRLTEEHKARIVRAAAMTGQTAPPKVFRLSSAAAL